MCRGKVNCGPSPKLPRILHDFRNPLPRTGKRNIINLMTFCISQMLKHHLRAVLANWSFANLSFISFILQRFLRNFKCQVVLAQEMMNCLMETRADRKDRQFILFIFRFSSHWLISQTCLKQKSSQSSSLATTN